MGTPAHRRLMKDYKELQSDTTLDGISAAPDPHNMLIWKGVICGPMDTHWEGGVFIISLAFEHDYPATPPKVKFISQIFHPNGTNPYYSPTSRFICFFSSNLLRSSFSTFSSLFRR